MNEVRQQPAFDLLSSIVGQADLIVTDPPYGINYQGGSALRIPRKTGPKQARRTERTFGPDLFDPSWLTAAYHALKPNSALYLFTRWDVASAWAGAITIAGFRVVQRLVWDKALWGMGDLRYYGSQTEDILFCVKGDHKLRWDKRSGNMIRIGRGRTMGKDGIRHPTQKPVDLLIRFIQNSSSAGDLVVDPFCGSGSTLVAAQRLGRQYLGGDIEPVYVDRAQRWLANQLANDPRCRMETLL